MTRVLVVGLPRSGTTWVGRAIGHAPETRAVGEPDNEDNFAFAIKAKRLLGRFPYLEPGASAPAAYEQLWEYAFAGGSRPQGARGMTSKALHWAAKSHTSVHRSESWNVARRLALRASVGLATPGKPSRSKHVVVKSVFVPLALGWVCERWKPRLVVVTRSALNTVGSWRTLGWPRPLLGHPLLADRAGSEHKVFERLLGGRRIPSAPTPEDDLRRLTWELCALHLVILATQARCQDSLVVQHESLCLNPLEQFRALLAELGLEWGEEVGEYLRSSNQQGEGTYDTRRIAADEADRWARRLSESESDTIRGVVESFGISW
jgi:hypothetical protein